MTICTWRRRARQIASGSATTLRFFRAVFWARQPTLCTLTRRSTPAAPHNVIFEKHPDDFEPVTAQIRDFHDTWRRSPATDYPYHRYALADTLPGTSPA